MVPKAPFLVFCSSVHIQNVLNSTYNHTSTYAKCVSALWDSEVGYRADICSPGISHVEDKDILTSNEWVHEEQISEAFVRP